MSPVVHAGGQKGVAQFDAVGGGEQQGSAEPDVITGTRKLKLAATAEAQGARESPLTDWEVKAIKEAKTSGKTESVLSCGQEKYNIVGIGSSSYMAWDAGFSPYIREEGRLNVMGPDGFRLALSEGRTATHGGVLRRYQDVTIVYPDGCFSTTAKCMGVVIEGVDPDSLRNAQGGGVAHARQLGGDFCRVGLPKRYFMKVFSALGAQKPAVWQNLQQTPRYFWVDASWGTSTVPMTFMYREGGESKTLGDQKAVHEMQGGGSILGLCELQLHLMAELTTVTDNRTIPVTDTYKIGVNLHKFIAQKSTSDRGPARTTSAELQLADLENGDFDDFRPAATTSAPTGGLGGERTGASSGDPMAYRIARAKLGRDMVKAATLNPNVTATAPYFGTMSLIVTR
jgi:hypothetical protein